MGFKIHLKQLMLKKSVEVDHRVTQTEVAQATGISIPTISRWYRNRVKRVEIDTVNKLITYFDCTFKDLVTWENRKNMNGNDILQDIINAVGKLRVQRRKAKCIEMNQPTYDALVESLDPIIVEGSYPTVPSQVVRPQETTGAVLLGMEVIINNDLLNGTHKLIE